MKKFLLLSVFLICIIPQHSRSQSLTVRFPDTNCLPGMIIIPVYLDGSAWIKSFDLQFSYWNMIVAYQNVININPLLGGSIETEYVTGDATDWVSFHWETDNPVNLAGTILYEIEIQYFGGYTELHWIDWADTSCAFYDSTGVILPASFISGSINLVNNTNELIQDKVKLFMSNPADHNSFTIQYPELKKKAQLWITDTAGKSIFTTELSPGSNYYHFPAEYFSRNNGIYLLRMRTSLWDTGKKVIIY